MKAFAPSNRRGSDLSTARAAGLFVLLSFGCAGSGSGGSTTGAGGQGGTTGSGGSKTGGQGGTPGSGSGGSATGGATASGGSGAGGNVGTGGSISSGAGGNVGAAGIGGQGGGGATGAGGTAGGGSTGAGGAGGQPGGVGGAGTVASHCGARPGMVFCDDFEADAPGAPPAPWTTMDGAAADVTIDGSDPAASGTKSVHVNSDGYDTFLALHDPSVLPVTGGPLYLRFFIRLAAAMTAQHNTFVRGDLYAAPGTGNNLLFGEDNYMIYESIIGDGQVAMSNNAYYSDGKMIGVNYPAGVWTCVELLLDHNAPAIDVWVNGTEVPDLHQTAWQIDAYDYLRFGFEQYAGPASEIWYDDIAIGTQQIGCN